MILSPFLDSPSQVYKLICDLICERNHDGINRTLEPMIDSFDYFSSLGFKPLIQGASIFNHVLVDLSCFV